MKESHGPSPGQAPNGYSTAPAEVGYRLKRRARSIRPGMHAGTETGGGLEPLVRTTLLDGRDPRRLDLLASSRDPLRRLLVRRYRQRASVRVYVLADLSASLGFRGRGDRIKTLASLVSALGFSAGRAGDAFAFIGCDVRLRREFLLPPTRMSGAYLDLADRLRECIPRGQGSHGLLEAIPLIGNRRALVFLVSDFHFPLALLESILAGVARHQVVPVVLEDSRESEPSPRMGLVRVRDPETGEERTLLMRPSLRHRLRAQAEQRRAAVFDCLAAHGAPPLVLTDRFDVDRVNRYFSP
ncbi:MAG: hypothetical protein F4Z93_00190 [Rhodospirillales bacterium]|nr:hypothetical protein [Rhodospirillales bacterium]